MLIKPLSDRVVVRVVLEDEQKAGAIVLTASAKEDPSQGVVEAVGPGAVDSKGNIVPLTVQVGDKVAFNHTQGKVEGFEDDLRILHESDLIAILVDK